MKTPLVVIVPALAAALCAHHGCSSSINALSQDGAAGRDAPTDAGGGLGGSGVSAGSGGVTNTGGRSATGGPAGITAAGGSSGAGGMSMKGGSAATGGATGGVGVDGGVDAATAYGGSRDAAGPGGEGGTSKRDAAVAGGMTSTGGSSAIGGGTGGSSGPGGSSGAGGGTGKDGGAVEDPCNYECLRGPTDGTGWYKGGKLVAEANCLGCVAVCDSVGSDSEGCYASCSGTGKNGLIDYVNCRPKNTTFRDSYLSWQASSGAASTGPAIVIRGAGWAKIWDSTAPFSPESWPSTNPTLTDKLTGTQIDDLYARLLAVKVESLPHAPLATSGCTGILYFQTCLECRPITLKYNTSQSVTPEMEQVWSWFDQLPGINGLSNPRNYCLRAGGDI